MYFHNRQDAGQQLLKKLSGYKSAPDTLVLGLARGGVVTAFEIAKGLNLPLDIIAPRKIGAPHNSEYAIGAITEDGLGVFNNEIIEMYSISPEYIRQQIEQEKTEAQRRLKLYRNNQPALNINNKTVLLVDDGIATGSTIRAAIAALKSKKTHKIIVVTPVVAPDTLQKISPEVDQVISLAVPNFFMAVGQFYQNFPQTTDQEVITLMQNAQQNYQ